MKTKGSTASIARIFVLKNWQNKGIAQNAIIQAEKFFDSYKLWTLDTIKQEKNNCHLYEKMGYKRTGKQE
ncbi:MAG: GNAT family N-acetyltransferase, partial [Eubacterium sp.]